MRKKKIICFMEIIFILLCMHAYSNYNLRQCAAASIETDFKPDVVLDPPFNIPLSDEIKVLSIKLMAQSGQRSATTDPNVVERNFKGDGFNKLSNKGYIVIKIIDDEENVVKSYTLKSGGILSKIIILNKGNYHFQYESKDDFEGYMEDDTFVWKLI